MKMTMKAANYASTGDVLYVLTMVLSLSLAVCVVLYGSDSNQRLFDKDWIKNGFCVSNFDVPYLNSHDTSFYSDVITASVMLCLYSMWRKEPHMKGINTSNIVVTALSTLGHGCGHGFAAYAMRQIALQEKDEAETVEDLKSWPLFVLFALIFWVPLLKASCNRMSWLQIVPCALVAQYGTATIPPQFGFTYTQTVLFLAHAINELTRPPREKGWEYAVYPMMVSVPVAIMGWVEPLACTAFYKGIGGHFWYDTTIGIGIVSFYITSFLQKEKTKVL